MMAIILKISPVIFIFFLGYVLKKINFLKKRDSDLFLKIVFYIVIPSLIILSVTRIKITSELIYLIIIAPIIIFITYFTSYVFGKRLRLEKSTLGAFLVGTMIINNNFVLPFIFEVYGDVGIALLSLFDFGNTLVVLTFVYYIATKYGDNKSSSKQIYKKFLYSAPIWALFLAILLNLGNIQIPVFIANTLQSVGSLLTPLLMLSVGIYFTPKIVNFVPVTIGVILRSFLGLLLGFVLVNLFDLQGVIRTIALIGSAAPAGFNTLTFSSLEKLDKEFAASLVSVSILFGIVFIPVLIAFLA